MLCTFSDELRVTGSRNMVSDIDRTIVAARRFMAVVQFFTALHVMQTRYCDDNSVRLSVCLSVCPSVTRVYCDKTVERSVQIFIPYERTFSLVF